MDDIIWSSGEPPCVGWYDCLIDGEEEDRLQWWICRMNPRKRHWKDINGNWIDVAHKVQWTGEASARFL